MKRILIVTGEASGDLHGANLIRAVQELSPDVQFLGIGGPRMADAGCEVLIPGEDISVMGLVEVIGHLPVIRRAFNRMKAVLQGAEPPAALVLIDFPDFNLRLAAVAKKAGIPVLYYVSPQVWAWRRGRVKKIAAVVDSLAAIFPFEPALYQGHDIKVEYVGHPLLDDVAVRQERPAYLRDLGIDPARPVVGIFPGSRRNELRYNLVVLLDAAEKIRAQRPDVAFLLPVASTVDRGGLMQTLAGRELPISLVDGNIYDTANACDAVLAVSGTVTLQIALVGTPLAILYRAAPLTYAIGRRLVKLPHFGLPNIVAGRGVVREFLQEAASAENLAAEMLRILEEPQYAQSVRDGLRQVRELLGEPGCARRVAKMLFALLESRSTTR